MENAGRRNPRGDAQETSGDEEPQDQVTEDGSNTFTLGFGEGYADTYVVLKKSSTAFQKSLSTEELIIGTMLQFFRNPFFGGTTLSVIQQVLNGFDLFCTFCDVCTYP